MSNTNTRRVRDRRRRYNELGVARRCPKTCHCECHEPLLNSIHTHWGKPCPGKGIHMPNSHVLSLIVKVAIPDNPTVRNDVQRIAFESWRQLSPDTPSQISWHDNEDGTYEIKIRRS